MDKCHLFMASFVLIIVVSGVLFYAQNNQIDELRAKLSQSEFKLDAKIASLDNKSIVRRVEYGERLLKVVKS